jgi:hypothetical protein
VTAHFVVDSALDLRVVDPLHRMQLPAAPPQSHYRPPRFL